MRHMPFKYQRTFANTDDVVSVNLEVIICSYVCYDTTMHEHAHCCPVISLLQIRYKCIPSQCLVMLTNVTVGE